MPVNKTIRNIFLALVVFFQLYLAYASTLYHTWFSLSFWIVAATAVVSTAVVCYFVCVVFEKKPLG